MEGCENFKYLKAYFLFIQMVFPSYCLVKVLRYGFRASDIDSECVITKGKKQNQVVRASVRSCPPSGICTQIKIISNELRTIILALTCMLDKFIQLKKFSLVLNKI